MHDCTGEENKHPSDMVINASSKTADMQHMQITKIQKGKKKKKQL